MHFVRNTGPRVEGERHKEPSVTSIREILSPRSVVAFLLIPAAAAPLAFAGSDYGDKDFSVRLPPAFIRFTEVSAMGGETAANRMSSAVNPAAAGWLELPSKYGLVVAPYYSGVSFHSGTNLHVAGESLTWDSKTWGTFQPVMSQMRTNWDTNRLGLNFKYDVDTCLLTWGKRFGKAGFGASISFSEARILNKLGSMRVCESHAENYRFRFGGLYEPVEKWLAGLVFEYGFSPYRTEALVLTPMGPLSVHMNGTEEHYILRPGISYEYAKLSTVYLDYQYGHFRTDRDYLQSDRFSAGVDHRLLDWLWVRGGAFFDARGNMGWTAGATAFPAEWCSVSVGYQYDMYPELRPEFGRANTVQITFSVRF